ncbi:TonB-dependent receptor [candidate division WOR-3 bacterium]|nr:TonB-dependent receptor [candidate division WOR-3 bacterium]
MVAIIILLVFSQIKGIVKDERGKPLENVNIVVVETGIGTTTDENGEYVIKNLPQGDYTIKATIIGYAPQTKRISLTANQPINVDFVLRVLPVRIEGVTVMAKSYNPFGYNLKGSQIDDSPEDLDIQRVLSCLPGVGTVEDYSGRITVRGGDPDENLTVVDNVEINYPVHYSWFGGDGGSITILPSDIIDRIYFYTGNFPVRFGDKLSSVIDIKLKTKKESVFSLNIGTANIGIESKNSSFIFSFRKSNLGLMEKLLNMGSTQINYQDAFLKTFFHKGEKDTFFFLFLYTDDYLHFDGSSSAPEYGLNLPEVEVDWIQTQNIESFIWKHHFTFIENFSVSLSRKFIQWEATQKGRGSVRTVETCIPLKIEMSHKGFRGGFDYRYLNLSHLLYIAPDTTPTNVPLPGDTFQNFSTTYKCAAYIEKNFKINRFEILPGVRWDWFGITRKGVVAPRISISGGISSKTTLFGGIGWYYQSPRYDYLTRNKTLDYECAIHYSAGAEYHLQGYDKVKFEIYRKDYHNLISPVSDSADELDNSGKGVSKGIEIYLVKEVSKKLILKCSYSLSTSKRIDRYGEHFSDWDQRHIINIVGRWELSPYLYFDAKWRFATGRPYTPIIGREQHPVTGQWLPIYGDINSARYPNYHRLDIKIAWLFSFHHIKGELWVNLWNVYNHKNILSYTYDNDYCTRREIYQFLFLPILGIKMEI